MKTLEQRKFEASYRQQEIARKSKKLGVLRSGKVNTSFSLLDSNELYQRGFCLVTNSKDSLSEKRLNKNEIVIDIRKK